MQQMLHSVTSEQLENEILKFHPLIKKQSMQIEWGMCRIFRLRDSFKRKKPKDVKAYSVFCKDRPNSLFYHAAMQVYKENWQ